MANHSDPRTTKLNDRQNDLGHSARFRAGFQLAVAFCVDLLLTPRQHVLRRDVAGGTVQADVVVMLHVASDVRHARDANELLEVASNELRAIVGDDSRPRLRVLLLGSLQNQFDIRFSHGLPQIPMHEETTEPIQNAAVFFKSSASLIPMMNFSK